MPDDKKPTSLVNGTALVIEDLDLQGFGLYSDVQKAELLAQGAKEYDFFEATGKAVGYWMRKSDEGKKWQVYDDPPEIFIHKNSIDYHGCLTGDCPHWKDSECREQLRKDFPEHADHGAGHDGPDDSDCPCRGTKKQEICGAAGCGFCMAAERDR